MSKYNEMILQKNTHISILFDNLYDYLYENIDANSFTKEHDFEDFQKYRKIYSDDYLNEIIDSLGINENEGRFFMGKSIIDGAFFYCEDGERESINQSTYVASMKKINIGCKKIIKELDTFSEIDNYSYYLGFDTALKDFSLNSKDLNNNVLLQSLFDRNYDTSQVSLLVFLEHLEKVSLEQINTPKVKTTPMRSSSLNIFISSIADTWQYYSPMPFRTGKYYDKNNGYISDQMHILEKIINPIDPLITNIQIGSAVRAYLSD